MVPKLDMVRIGGADAGRDAVVADSGAMVCSASLPRISLHTYSLPPYAL
jgi:hypothetical protein